MRHTDTDYAAIAAARRTDFERRYQAARMVREVRQRASGLEISITAVDEARETKQVRDLGSIGGRRIA